MNFPSALKALLPARVWLAGIVALTGCAALVSCVSTRSNKAMERIIIAPGGKSFVTADTRRPFTPWGVNYGNAGRLMEDFWDADWNTFAADFREIKAMGGNVVRVHLQFGKFMDSTNAPNAAAFRQLRRMLALAESTGLYLDITGLACYRTSDVPGWYDALDDAARWAAQANFWRAVAAAGASSPAVFCYNLMNEPVSPHSRRDNWYSGHTLGGYDFIQYIARDPAGRSRREIAVAWIDQLSAAIREKDTNALITVGLLPWVTNWKHLSGFVPREIAPHVDFISVHLYPKTKLPEEAPFALSECVVGKPVVIEEVFALECSTPELVKFLRDSRAIACGWIWHYDGITLREYDAMQRAGSLTITQAVWRENLRSFVRLKPEFVK